MLKILKIECKNRNGDEKIKPAKKISKNLLLHRPAHRRAGILREKKSTQKALRGSF